MSFVLQTKYTTVLRHWPVPNVLLFAALQKMAPRLKTSAEVKVNIMLLQIFHYLLFPVFAMAEARLAELTSTLQQYDALNCDGSVVDKRTLARNHPEYDEATLAIIDNAKKLYRNSRDTVAKKRRLAASVDDTPVVKRGRPGESPEEYEARREHERQIEANYRANRERDAERAAKHQESVHQSQTSEEYRAQQRAKYAATMTAPSIVAKVCEVCGVKRNIAKFYVDPACAICLICQSDDQ
jgi:hypothetical protein